MTKNRINTSEEVSSEEREVALRYSASLLARQKGSSMNIQDLINNGIVKELSDNFSIDKSTIVNILSR